MSVPHIDDIAIDRLLSLSSIYGAVNEALKDWGNGNAANTIRVRASAKGQMASAMAAVAPPYSGGKVYATKDGVFTFLNVLFDDQGNLLCTLDGDVLTRLRTPVLCQIAIEKFAPENAPPALEPKSIPSVLAKPKAPLKPPPPLFSSSMANVSVALYVGF